MLKQCGILVTAAIIARGASSCNSESGTARRQVANILTVETGQYTYEWQLHGRPNLVFVLNETFQFCKRGSFFFVDDAEGRRRKFSVVTAIKRLPPPPAAQLPPRGFAANLKQGPPSSHEVQVDKNWKAWMSTSGPEHYLVRADGEHVYVEQVLDASAWLKIDTTLSGTLYTGTVEYGFANPIGKPCSYRGSVEFVRVEPSRIQGAMTVLPESAVIDANCRSMGPGPRIERFTWIPE